MNRSPFILIVALAAVALSMLLAAKLRHSEPMARSLVLGCYVAPASPPLNIRDDAIHIIGPKQRVLDYLVEPSKTGYQLNVTPALELKPKANGRYDYSPTSGSGFFWPLLPAEGRNRDRVRHPAEYAGRFRMFASDGTEVTYTRIGKPGCP